MAKGFLEELSWRGLIHDKTPGIEKILKEGGCTGYIGFDPTAVSMTIGNYVQIMLLRFFQRAGHRPIVLMGGATGRIGDPSGRDQERVMKSYDELDRNLSFQTRQVKQFLDFEGPNGALLLNNLDFYKNMNVLDFMRDAGKNLTVNYMLSKDSVKRRLETGISYTEFSYQLLQAYDYLRLFQDHNCIVQMGGSDQWGNITSGTEFIRRNTANGKAYAVTTPLLTKSDGSKFGKSEQGNVWLDPELTSPYQFYQFWINAADDDIPTYLRYFSMKDQSEIEQLETDLQADPRTLKRLFAEEITTDIHGSEMVNSVQSVSELLFGRKFDETSIHELTRQELSMVTGEIPNYKISKNLLNPAATLDLLLTEHAPVFQSKGEFRRAVKGNALSLNKKKISSFDLAVSPSHLLKSTFILIENGKKNKFILEFI